MTPATTDPLDWDALIARVRGGHGSDARRQVGAWAMAQVRKALGERWPQRWLARYGTLPAFAWDPASDAFAYAQLVETGLRLHALDGALRLPTVISHWSSQLEDISTRHAWIQLEVAALARFHGAAVEFETPLQLPATERPADVVLTTEDAQLVAECFCIYTDQDTRESAAYDREFGFRLSMIGLDMRLSGHYDVRLPKEETEQLLSDVEQAAAGVQADGVPRDVTRPGIEIHLAPWSEPGDTEVTLEGPVTPGAEWRRARGKIHDKAQDWEDSPVPAWLRFDLLDGTWLFSDWAQRPLPDKTMWMAALITEALAGTGVAGVVVSCGPRLDTASPDETYAAAGGISGLRRRLDPLRARETIIVPLSTAGAKTAPMWTSLYDLEPRWLDDALMRASLPGVDDIERGWAAPR
jgi:hypothetical protein